MATYLYIPPELESFSFYTISAGMDHIQTPISRPDGTFLHQAFLVEKGSGEVTISGEIFPVEKDDMFIIPAGVPHSYRGYTEDFSTAYLGFTGKGYPAILGYYGIDGFRLFKGKNSGNFLIHIKRVLSSTEKPDNLPALSAEGYAAAVAFFDEVTRKEYTPVEKVYNYLEIHFKENITLDDLLLIFPYSKSKLCGDFSAKYGMSVFEMLNKIRLRNANDKLITTPGIKLREVIASCGFNDMSYFCKLYKREFKKTPKSD